MIDLVNIYDNVLFFLSSIHKDIRLLKIFWIYYKIFHRKLSIRMTVKIEAIHHLLLINDLNMGNIIDPH